MPVFQITSPDGKKYKVTAPEGTTREQAIARVQGDSAPKEFSASEMVSNIPGSGAQFAKDITYPIRHPIDTAKALGGLAAGGASLLGEQVGISIPQLQQYEKYPEQVGQFISGRYGSVDKAKQTLMNDPVGALADVSGLLTGGGSIAAKLPGLAGKAGKAVQRTGIMADPINAAVVAPAKAAGRGLMGLFPETLPRDMYLSSAKFPTTLDVRADIADTALREGIMPTSAGVGKFETLKSGLIDEIDRLISQATETGTRIPRAAVYRYLNDARDSVGGPRVRAKRNLKQIDDVAREFDTYMDEAGINSLSPNEMQIFKKSVFTEAKYDAKSLKSGVGTDAAMKQLGRAARESVESTADVGLLNKRLGGLLELEDPLKRSAGRIDNLNMSGIGTPIKIAAGQAVAGPFGAGVAAAQSILEMPKVKARLAIALKRSQEGGKISPFDQSLIRTLMQQGLLQSGRLADN